MAAIASLAMADAAEAVGRPRPTGTIRLKWPNDLVIELDPRGGARDRRRRGHPLAGVLGETDGLGTADPRVVVGLGINADWPAADFPPELAASMTSLRESSHGRPIDLDDCCSTRSSDGWKSGRRGAPTVAGSTCADWADRQLTTGRTVRLERPGRPRPSARSPSTRDRGARSSTIRDAPGGERHVLVGEITHVRLADARQRRRCNAMARPAFWKVDRPEEGGPRLVHLDRDRRLVEAAQADPARFEALYRKYLAQVYSYAFYELRDHHEAEDATERTFLAALANLGRFEERARPDDGEGASTFRVWLFQIARNAVAERRRRHAPPAGGVPRGRRRDRRRRSTSRPTQSSATEAAAALRAVDRLPGDRRRALILRFVDEMSTAEIAGVLGRSEGAVRVLIHRAPAQRRARPRRPPRR